MILVIAEQRDGKLNRASWESIAGAQRIGACLRRADCRGVPGAGVDGVASELAAASVAEVVTLDSAVLASYTADGFTAALQAAIAELSPSLVVLPHTYQTRDFAPKLAARLDRAIITDVTGVKSESGRQLFVRPMFQGKLTADVAARGPDAAFRDVSDRSIPARSGGARRHTAAPVRALAVAVDPAVIRQRPEAPFQEARQAVDLSQAERIVSVGRGIKEQANIALAQAAGRSARRRARRVTSRSAMRAGCRWNGRLAAPARRSRRSCISRWASPAPFSTWSG